MLWFIMAARQLCWPTAILFYCCRLDLLYSFFLFCHLISELGWPIITKLCRVFNVVPYLCNSVRHLGPLPPKFAGPRTKFLRNFGQLLDCEYLRSATRHCQSENGFANYGYSHSGKLNLMYFGPQMGMAKNSGVTKFCPGIYASPCTAAPEKVLLLGPGLIWSNFYRASAVAASPVIATIGMSVCPSVCPSVRPSVTR